MLRSSTYVGAAEQAEVACLPMRKPLACAPTACYQQYVTRQRTRRTSLTHALLRAPALAVH